MDDVVGDGCAPFADFGVFGNADYVSSRKPRVRGMQPNPDGTWSPVELTGPPTHAVWQDCWAVFRVLVGMMRILTTSVTDEYSGRIKFYYDLYGPGCWRVILLADIKARSRYWERSRRQAVRLHRLGKLPDFDPENPWEVSLRLLLSNEAFWNENVNMVCVLVAARAAAQTRVGSEGAAPRAAAASSSTALALLPNPTQPSDLSQKGPDGKYTHNRKGLELCPDYKAGRCPTPGVNGRCPRDSNKTHQCGLCLQQHADANHGKPPVKAKAKAKGRTKGRKQ